MVCSAFYNFIYGHIVLVQLFLISQKCYPCLFVPKGYFIQTFRVKGKKLRYIYFATSCDFKFTFMLFYFQNTQSKIMIISRQMNKTRRKIVRNRLQTRLIIDDWKFHHTTPLIATETTQCTRHQAHRPAIQAHAAFPTAERIMLSKCPFGHNSWSDSS